MLIVKNISIHYYYPVLKVKELQFSTGLHIIQGESGSGKSSLLRCLALCEKTYQEYMWNHQIIKDTQDFQKQHIGFLKQSPIFIDDLTVYEHIQMMNKVYRYQQVDDYIQKLELKSLLKKYPQQLSGGEKTRVGLLLILLKQPEILILDEPTSSLDLHMTRIVIEILHDYACHHIVIVASHDQELTNQADVLYTIENQTISYTGQLVQQELSFSTHQPRRLSAFFISTRLLKKHSLYSFVMYTLIALSLFITSSSLSLLLFSSVTQMIPLTSVYDNEILIYKPTLQTENSFYTSEGLEYPLTQDEISQIQQIQHIQSLYPDYSYKMATLQTLNDPLPLDNFFTEGYHITVSTSDKQNITPLNSDFSDTMLCSYNELIDYSEDIETQLSYDSHGVYLSQSLANELQIQSEDSYYLTFYMPIPTYQGYGDAIIPFQNEDGSYGPDGYPVLRLFGTYQQVTLPVNGILKKVNMGISPTTEFSYNKIFIPQSFIQEQIEINTSKEDITYYWSNRYNQYMTTLEKGDSSQKTMICKPYQPTIYKAQIDSIENLPEILPQINQLGLVTINANINLSQIQEYSQNTNQVLLILSTIVMIVLMMIYNITLYLKKDSYLQIYHFLQSFGYSPSKIKSTIRLQHFYNTLFLTLVTSLLTLIYLYIIGPLFEYPIHLQSMIFFIIPIITFLTLFIIPNFIFYFILRKEGLYASTSSHPY